MLLMQLLQRYLSSCSFHAGSVSLGERGAVTFLLLLPGCHVTWQLMYVSLV